MVGDRHGGGEQPQRIGNRQSQGEDRPRGAGKQQQQQPQQQLPTAASPASA
jgi:hypothetical protein